MNFIVCLIVPIEMFKRNCTKYVDKYIVHIAQRAYIVGQREREREGERERERERERAVSYKHLRAHET